MLKAFRIAKRFVTALALIATLSNLEPGLSFANPGPDPTGSPLYPVQGGYAFDLGCLDIPSSVTGGCKGAGSLNVQNLFVNGIGVSFNSSIAAALSQTPNQPGGLLLLGSLSGNTTQIATVSGSLTNGHCITTDANLNLIDSGAACGSGGGGGGNLIVGSTPITGGTNSAILYDNSGILGNLVLGTGVSSALQATSNGTGAFVLTNSPSIHTAALGTPSSIMLTNATNLPVSTGISGLGSGIATALAQSPTGSGGIVLATAPTLTGMTVTGVFTATGLVTNADLVHSSVSINGSVCTLGTNCTVTPTASALYSTLANRFGAP